jgi:glycosyltransferase involved in cell wall biosynthesis
LIDAAEDVVHRLGRTDVQFAIVGPGDARAELQRNIDARRLGAFVELPGAVDDDLVRAYLCTADVCVGVDQPNAMNDKAAMRKVLEYMALGKAVVQFPLAEMQRLCGDASAYARSGDANDLAARICELLDDDSRRLALGDAARRRAWSGLMWPQQVPALMASVEAAMSTRCDRKWSDSRQSRQDPVPASHSRRTLPVSIRRTQQWPGSTTTVQSASRAGR